MSREHLKLLTQGGGLLEPDPAQLQHSWEAGAADPDTFASMLGNLVHSRRIAAGAKSVGAPLCCSAQLCLGFSRCCR